MPKGKQPNKTKKKNPAARPAPRVVKAPAQQGPWRARREHVTRSGDTVRIEHREIVAPVVSSVTPDAYTADVYSLNPSSSTFPWLQNASRIYDQYRLKRLSLRFVSNSRTTRDGTVAMAVDFDVNDLIPTSIADVARLRDSAAAQIHQPYDLHVVTGQQAQNWYYTAEAAGVTDRLSDVGKIIVALQGIDTDGVNGFTCGYLEVHYVYEFRMPELITLDVAEPAEYTIVNSRGVGVNSADLLLNDAANPIMDTSGVNGTIATLVNATTRRAPNANDGLISLGPGLYRILVKFLKDPTVSGWAFTNPFGIVTTWVDSINGDYVTPALEYITQYGKTIDASGTALIGFFTEFYVTLTNKTYMFAHMQNGGANWASLGGTSTFNVTRALPPILGSPVVNAYGRFDATAARNVKDHAPCVVPTGPPPSAPSSAHP